MLRGNKNFPCCSRPGQCQRREETDGGECQIEEWHRATKKTAAGKREEEGRYVQFGSQQRLPLQIECMFVFKKTSMLLSFTISSYRSGSVCLPGEHLMSVVANYSIVCFLLSVITSWAFSLHSIITRSFFVSNITTVFPESYFRVMGTACLSAIVHLTYYIDIRGQTTRIINTHLMFSR